MIKRVKKNRVKKNVSFSFFISKYTLLHRILKGKIDNDLSIIIKKKFS